MSQSKSPLTIILATAGAFFTGVAVGLLISPKSGKENRKWLRQQADDVTDWVDHYSKDAIHITENKINELKNDVKQTIKNNIPDLYEATEDIHLTEEELIERENDRG